MANPFEGKTSAIAAGKAGAALAKAKKLGIPVLSEEDFERLQAEAGPVTEAQLRAFMR
jgi:BRCT domain type II-containing protein